MRLLPSLRRQETTLSFPPNLFGVGHVRVSLIGRSWSGAVAAPIGGPAALPGPAACPLRRLAAAASPAINLIPG